MKIPLLYEIVKQNFKNIFDCIYGEDSDFKTFSEKDSA